jgi:hypothetical protein
VTPPRAHGGQACEANVIKEVDLTCIIDAGPKRHLSKRLAGGFVLAALLTLGTYVAPAGAQPRHDDHHDDHHGGDRRVVRHDDDRHDYHGGGYYPAPPVVYGGPVYAAPPLVYGPTIGINLPGLSIGIQ